MSNAITPAGRARLEAELALLNGEKKMALIERLEEAKSGAELFENSELLLALEDFKLLNQRIARLRSLLDHACLIEDPVQDGVIRLGSRITIQFEDDEPECYVLVGSIEADPTAGFVSDASPLGLLLLNQSASETPITFQTPDGPRMIRILKVQ